jgi:hypothetical protein
LHIGPDDLFANISRTREFHRDRAHFEGRSPLLSARLGPQGHLTPGKEAK